jgi:hypothetical protein
MIRRTLIAHVIDDFARLSAAARGANFVKPARTADRDGHRHALKLSQSYALL